MLFLLSPAKSLDYESPMAPVGHTRPVFARDAEELVGVLRRKSPQELAQMMDLSDALASLNAARYQAWSPRFAASNSRQAVLAFNGDVYEGLEAKSLSAAQLDWAQEHVCILSGLYGVLRPLDWMQPYRLEMGTGLANARGKNLYQFWGTRIAEYLNERQSSQKAPVVVNLASQEYFKSVDRKVLKAEVVDCVFEEYKAGSWKVVSFMAKRARGLMARHAILRKVTRLSQLEQFNSEGYVFDEQASTSQRMVFRRRSSA